MKRIVTFTLMVFLFPEAARATDGERMPLFSRHVVPLLSRLGCNAGVCHGSVKGQNGFRLSLFGVDPAVDHHRIVREEMGRRFDVVHPDNSLFLTKAAGKVSHGGGKRMDVGSPEYQTLRNWIAGGARLDDASRSNLTRLTVTPAQQTLKNGEGFALKVEATFADGSKEDVTDLCTFEARDPAVASVDASGRAKATGVGDTALVIRYRAEPVMTMVLVPGEARGNFPEVKEHNFVDKHVLDKLRLLQIHPAPLCDDITFLRRLSLDVTGSLPTPEEIRAFQADKDAGKRTKKIDELLGRSGHAALWATRFSDLLKPGNYFANAGLQELPSSRRFYEWLRARLQENTPYDELTERILLATSRDGRSEEDWVKEIQALAEEEAKPGPGMAAYSGRRTLDLYWQRTNAAGVKGTLQITHAFLGLRMECAQCHRHPNDVWQQDDLLSFANFFMRVSAGGGNASSPGVIKQADKLTGEVKDLKDELKKLTDKAKDKSLPKEDMVKLQQEAKGLSDRVKMLEDMGKRLKATEIHTAAKGGFASVTSPLGKQESKQYRLLGSKQPETVSADEDPRLPVMAWLRQPDNPFFAKAIVNRVWAHYFGRGIVDPPDHLSPLNPPSHPELLAELTTGFIANKYDLKWLHRTILHSRTYQQSARTNATSKTDTRNYASFYPRRLPAEVLVDALNHATGGKETYPAELRLPADARAIEVAGSVEAGKERASLAYAFRIFGRPLRAGDVQCDCERDSTPTVVQTLYLANHPRVLEKINSQQGRLAQITKDLADDGKRIEELFLWTLSRLPTDEERQACSTLLKESSSTKQGMQDLLWSLLNTKEFLLNY
ncbi:MAG: DUF1549 and DUF1553 domain-containing protein [Gemmataceae bacterium]|nr:DUF1549 and DUF1553 domain-containing protein [Gemmataceae bacterium]